MNISNLRLFLGGAHLANFICNKERIYLAGFFNRLEDITFLENKWKTYCRYREFYHRQVLWSPLETKESLGLFFNNHDYAVLKPVDGSFGKGVNIVLCSDYAKNIKKVYDEYPNGVLIEEKIEQDNTLGQLHKESVNTVRIYTITNGCEVIIFHPWLRIGRGHNVIDNASAGGVGAAIDLETGIIQSARDKSGHTFFIHPDTQKNIIGLKIPRWDELKEMVKNIALVNPTL